MHVRTPAKIPRGSPTDVCGSVRCHKLQQGLLEEYFDSHARDAAPLSSSSTLAAHSFRGPRRRHDST